MSDNDNSSNENTQNSSAPAPKNFAGLKKQVQAEIDKGATGAAKNKAAEIMKKIAEHARSIRQLEAELDELGEKFDAGIL